MNAGDHIYIHVPFCSGKCAYCAFYSERFTPDLCDSYLDALEKELTLRFAGSEPEPKTIYIGGGTPSILDPQRLKRLLAIIKTYAQTHNTEEWTVEANPGTLSSAKIRILLDAGVNRISLGAQSFDDVVLKHIGRRHNVADTVEAVNILRQHGITNIGLDMIACLPGVAEQTWLTSLEQAVSLGPKHISVYGLTIEPGSKFGHLLAEGKMQKPDDQQTLNALSTAIEILNNNSYNRYEISNYSRTGFECAHNTSCWRGEDYIGFGPAASSRSRHRRWTNESDLNNYCKKLLTSELPPRSEETVDAETDITERLIFAFRLAEGVDLASFQSKSSSINEWRKEALTHLMHEELVSFDKERWCLTEKGKPFADLVAERLIRLSQGQSTGERSTVRAD
ncbi:MAG: radical SAM family heme chaperone HemW [Kiritimatiellae bacterium]|nr:radical SAM family heme chaperone HemW [Kiritimatiellia bacterium]